MSLEKKKKIPGKKPREIINCARNRAIGSLPAVRLRGARSPYPGAERRAGWQSSSGCRKRALGQPLLGISSQLAKIKYAGRKASTVPGQVADRESNLAALCRLADLLNTPLIQSCTAKLQFNRQGFL